MEGRGTCCLHCGLLCSRSEAPFLFDFIFSCLNDLFVAPGLPPRPAQGLTPPLHPRKEHRPLTRLRWRDHLELREPAVSIAGCGASRPETHAFLFSFSLGWRAPWSYLCMGRLFFCIGSVCSLRFAHPYGTIADG